MILNTKCPALWTVAAKSSDVDPLTRKRKTAADSIRDGLEFMFSTTLSLAPGKDHYNEFVHQHAVRRNR